MNADTSDSNTPGLASLYLAAGIGLDILETVFNNADVHVQTDFLIYLMHYGGPADADLANFASLGKHTLTRDMRVMTRTIACRFYASIKDVTSACQSAMFCTSQRQTSSRSF